jgi:hypothetical protein
MRTRIRGAIAAAVAVTTAVTMAGAADAVVTTTKVYEDSTATRPAFSASGELLGDVRPEWVVSDYGNYSVVAGQPIIPPGATWIYTNAAKNKQGGDLNDWSTVQVYGPEAGITFPSQPVLSDVDGDGDNDILQGGGFFWDSFTGLNRGTLTWWENRANGMEWIKHTIVENSPWAFHNLQYVDFDGDGIKDIVTVGEQGLDRMTHLDDLTELQLYKGLGGGEFAPSVALANRGGSNPVVYDVDNDGDLDVASAQYFHVSATTNFGQNALGDANFVWFERTGTDADGLDSSDFVKHEISRLQGPSYGFFPAPNLYGDGVMRWIGTNHTNTTPGNPGPPIFLRAAPNAFVLTPGADPTQPWAVEPLADTYDAGAQWAANPRPGQAAPGKVVQGDFDRDGDTDVAISGDGDFRVMMIEQTAPGVFHQSVLPGSEGYGQAGITSNDFNRDGILEIGVSAFENQKVGLWTTG